MSSRTSDPGAPVCARPGCDEPVKTGRMYCGNSCRAKDAKRYRTLKNTVAALPSVIHEMIPDAAEELVSLIGQDALPVLEELAITLQENRSVPAPPLRKLRTESGVDDFRYGVLQASSGKSYRASDALSYDTVDDMMRNGQVLFTLAIKQAAIHSVIRDDRTWKVDCSNERTKKLVHGMMSRVFRAYGKEFMEFMPYGAAFFEKEWKLRPAQEWGVEGVNGKLYGYEKLAAIHPSSIEHIDYVNKGRKFNGFTQRHSTEGPIHVRPENALVLTYDKKFRNLWGNPACDPMYPYWFWLEVSWRSFVRYLERTGTPVTVVYAPSKGFVNTPDGTQVQTMKYALVQAGYITRSNSAAFPSDVSPDTGEQLWRVEYLQDQSRGDQFIKAIQALGTAMARSVVIGDRAATQDAETGSFNAAQTHWMVTQLHNQMVLDELLEQCTSYLAEPIRIYNTPLSGPPVRLITQTLDPAKLDRLYKLLNTMGNQQGSPAMEKIDWDKVLEINDVPVLTQEQIDKNFEDRMERQKTQNEIMAEAQAKTGQPYQKGQQAREEQERGQRPGSSIKQSREWMEYQLAQGAEVPAYVSNGLAQELADRATERPIVFDMGASMAPVDIEADAIVEEMLDELDISELSEGELKELKDYILGMLALRRKNVALVQDMVVIELGLRSFLGNVLRKARQIVDRVVKKVTGRDLADWKGTRAASPGRGKYVPSTGTVITKDGQVWREEDHPRDKRGRFAERGTGKAAPPGEERSQYEATFAPENWQRIEDMGGIYAIDIDGYRYGSVGEPDPVVFAQIHDTRLRMEGRAAEMGYPLENKPPLIVYNWDDREGVLRYLHEVHGSEATLEELDSYIEESGGHIAHYIPWTGQIEMSAIQADKMPYHFEVTLFHESLHAQPREKGSTGRHSVYWDPDEIYTTLLTMQYGEKYNLPVTNGYPVWVGWVAQAAKEKGWSKQELYEHALAAHKIDGEKAYERIVEDLVADTSVWMYKVDDNYRATYDRRMDVVDDWWPTWRQEMSRVAKTYGIDEEEFFDLLMLRFMEE